jgi:ketosteroid isomerase-like protein
MRTTTLIAACCLLALALSVRAGNDDSAATVAQFHDALHRGDAAAAMKLLAPDVAILESGSAETRAEYEADHLPEDIRFAQTVDSTRSDVHVEVSGETAWLTSRMHSEGSFEGKPVNSVGVELVVLTRAESGWLIRAVHWSSRKS